MDPPLQSTQVRGLNFSGISPPLTLNMTILGSNPRKISSQSYVLRKVYYLLRNSPQFAHIGVFNRDADILVKFLNC
jgi:hypothetical protein